MQLLFSQNWQAGLYTLLKLIKWCWSSYCTHFFKELMAVGGKCPFFFFFSACWAFLSHWIWCRWSRRAQTPVFCRTTNVSKTCTGWSGVIKSTKNGKIYFENVSFSHHDLALLWVGPSHKIPVKCIEVWDWSKIQWCLNTIPRHCIWTQW